MPMGHYARQISRRMYAAVPKEVFAAFTTSIVENGGVSVNNDDTPDAYIAREWVLLFKQGLVAAMPPRWVCDLAAGRPWA